MSCIYHDAKCGLYGNSLLVKNSVQIKTVNRVHLISVGYLIVNIEI